MDFSLKKFLERVFRPTRYRTEKALEDVESGYSRIDGLDLNVHEEVQRLIELSNQVERELIDPESIESDFVTVLGTPEPTSDQIEQVQSEAAEIADSIDKLMEIKELSADINQKLQRAAELSQNIESIEQRVDEASKILAFGLDRVEGEFDEIEFPDRHYPPNYDDEDIEGLVQKFTD